MRHDARNCFQVHRLTSQYLSLSHEKKGRVCNATVRCAVFTLRCICVDIATSSKRPNNGVQCCVQQRRPLSLLHVFTPLLQVNRHVIEQELGVAIGIRGAMRNKKTCSFEYGSSGIFFWHTRQHLRDTCFFFKKNSWLSFLDQSMSIVHRRVYYSTTGSLSPKCHAPLQ